MADTIVLDGLPLQVRSAGIGVYTDQLVRAAAAQRPHTDFVLYGMVGPGAWVLGQAASPPPLPANVHWLRAARYPLVMGYPFPALPRLLPVRLGARTPSLFHATNYAAPRTGSVPLVVTVHDLALLRFPELGTPALRRIVGRARSAVAAARLVIADSEATGRDLRELLAVPTERVRVVYPGRNPACRPQNPSQARRAVAERFGLATPYILHVGTLEPRKNLPRLIEALARLRERGGAHLLVLAGADGWGAEAVTRAIAAHGLQGVVRRLGRVARADLPALYAAAEAFAFPSLYEGFGLPILEAMACGTPVVTANVSALPEVAGDAALLADPRDAGAIAAALARLLGDAALRRELRDRGLAQASRFSWERCARETMAVYDEAMGEGRRKTTDR